MRYLILAVALICSACSTTHIAKLPDLNDAEKAELYVYRKPNFATGGSKAIFGANMQNYVVLGNKDYSKISIEPGKYNFFVKDKPFMDLISIKASPYYKEVFLQKNKKKCLAIYPNKKKVLTDAVVGVPSGSGSIFVLEEINCPIKVDTIDNKKYTLKPVLYRK